MLEASSHNLVAVALAAVVGLCAAFPALAAPPGSAAAGTALALCYGADRAEGDAKDALLARCRALAEQAIAADGRDAEAHFALFCALGKQMDRAGLGLGQLAGLRRLRGELDTALALAPEDNDVLAAKGAMLLRLPRLLGGDVGEAERLLRRAFAADPRNDEARCYLVRALSARGADDEARALRAGC